MAETMAANETLNILEEIQALVSDKLQVVSYKWLSRNFSVQSNDAKRLLQDFVDRYGSGLEIIYSLSGWLKSNPQAYHVCLAPAMKLSEAKQNFKDNCSIQVYSVQASRPKDPAVLWSIEFAQAEELFDQPSTINNCLRDNRFCGITNSFVKRNIDEKTAAAALNLPKISLGRAQLSSKTNSIPRDATTQQHENENSVQPIIAAGTSAVKITSGASDDNAQSNKMHTSKETSSNIHSKKDKVPKDKAVKETEGSLANMWGRATTKLKSTSAATINDATAAVPIVQAHASSSGALENVDDEDEDISFKREVNGGGRKRKVVFDFSDDEDDEDIVSLASPESPNRQLPSGLSHNGADLVAEKKVASTEATIQNEMEANQMKDVHKSGLTGKGEMVHDPIDKCPDTSIVENKMKKNEAAQTPSLPKRKKVLVTRIDERGREVTEVVWEGEAADTSDASKLPPSDDKESRLPAAVKRPPVNTTASSMSNTTGRAGSKKNSKGGSKDAKQGNILSFFKKI